LYLKGISWTTVRYMIAECQYGGRVTDEFDKRLLNTFTVKWFGEHMFTTQFFFSHKTYTIPKYTKFDEVLNCINGLSQSDTPEAFGLHSNADITYQTNTVRKVLDTILSIQPKESSGGQGETRESVVYRIAQDMLDKLPPDYVQHEVKARLEKMGALSSMNIFLRQEIDRMQKVIVTVRRTLVDLKLAIDGTIIMNETLRDALDTMYDAKIPSAWQKVHEFDNRTFEDLIRLHTRYHFFFKISWESSTLGFWFTELIERNNQFKTWCFDGRPTCFWMTGFFNAQGFLTAMKQVNTTFRKFDRCRDSLMIPLGLFIQ
jgi:dynein heavy chain